MLKINYTPSTYVFTCNIPSEIEISTDAASVYVTIACGPDTIFESTLYPYNNTATLYDARSIIEGHLLDKQRVFSNFVITADTKTEEATTPERHFIYSRLSLATNAMGFVQLFFLTTRSMFTIPRNSFQSLSAFYLPDVALQGYTECLALFDGESTPRMVRIEDAKVDTKNSTLIRDIISPIAIETRIGSKCRLLQFTVHRSFLAKTFYVTDRTPNLTLLVRNEFNCDEYIHLTCVTKSKLDLDRSTATSLGVTTFYDDKSAYEYDVESSMLTFEEAKHFSQLLLSRHVNIVEKGGALAPITVTDINSEISDADNATNSIKFKYKYSSHHFPITIDYGNNIFNDPFHRTFD